MSITKPIDRKEFFTALGVSAAALAFICTGCSSGTAGGKGAATAPVTKGVDFTLDLTAAENSALKPKGGFLLTNNLVIAKTATGSFIAVQQACTHQGNLLAYQSEDHQFYCSAHGSSFSEAGKVINGPAEINLAVYKTTLTGNMLRIHS